MTDDVFFQILNQTPSVELPLVSYLITAKRKATYIITLASSGHGHCWVRHVPQAIQGQGRVGAIAELYSCDLVAS